MTDTPVCLRFEWHPRHGGYEGPLPFDSLTL